MGGHPELGYQLPKEYQLQVRDGKVHSMESQELLVPTWCGQSFPPWSWSPKAFALTHCKIQCVTGTFPTY